MYKIFNVFIFISILTIYALDNSNLNADHLDEFDGEFRLSGQIVNGTSPTDETIYEIKLMATQNSSSELIDIEIINTNKNFDFKKVIVDEAFTYFLIVNHQDIPTIVFVEDIENPENINITVYDRVFTPKDIDVIDYSIMVPHISPDSDIISVLGLISFTNNSNSTYFADLTDPNTSGLNLLRFSLPENFENLSVDSDLPPGNVMQIPTGFALSNPVPPGDHQILYSYSMPRNTGSIKYNIRLPFGSKKFKILVPEKSKISSEYNLLKDSTLVDDKKYELLQGQNIKKGEVVVVDLINISKPGTLKKITYFIEKNSVPFFVGSITGLILLLILIFSFLRSNSRRRNLELNSDIYIDKIIDLDERFEKNKINKEEYEILRENYKKNIKG
tara:strand:+ start:4469 stop:5632 length:1164 start_codon:yes stop_codon:yes gene_type:complete